MVLILVLGQHNQGLVKQAILFYLFAYLIATIGVFAVLNWSELFIKQEREIRINDWQGLMWQKTGPAILLLTSFLTLAGIPLTAGFIGKFYIMMSATAGQLWWLLSGIIVGSGIALAYYLPIIYCLFKPACDNTAAPIAAMNVYQKQVR